MNVLGIVGSPRKDGRTNHLVDAALDGAASQQAAVAKVYLVDYAIQPYLGQRDVTYCPDALSRRCEDADAIILGAPIYVGDVSGVTKNFMETVRISNAAGKPALGISVAGGTGKGVLSGVQTLYQFFFQKQMRGVHPTPVSRFNMDQALNQLRGYGADLVALAEQSNPFTGVTRDACWPDVVAHYAELPYMDGDPLDEFVLLAEQLVRISRGPDAEAATAELEAARALLADGQRSAAARNAVGAYQRLYYSPRTR